MSIFLKTVRLLYDWADLEQQHRRKVLSLFEPNPKAKLLDLGCRDGDFTLEVAKKIGTGKVFGIDVIEEHVEKARARGIDCYQANLNEAKLPFEDESFDAVCANHVIEHLSDTDGFIKEIHRVIKPGGYAVISTPNLAAWHNIFFLLLGWQPYATNVSDEDYAIGQWVPWIVDLSKRKGTYPQHRRVFTVKALTEFLNYHRFKVERTVCSGFLLLSPPPIARVASTIDKAHSDNIIIKARKINLKEEAGT